MVNCSRKKDNWVRLSSQNGQFSAFKGFFYKRGRGACLFIFYQFSYKKSGGYPPHPYSPKGFGSYVVHNLYIFRPPDRLNYVVHNLSV